MKVWVFIGFLECWGVLKEGWPCGLGFGRVEGAREAFSREGKYLAEKECIQVLVCVAAVLPSLVPIKICVLRY